MNSKDEYGESLLKNYIFYADQVRVDICARLVQAGISVNECSPFEWATPLHACVWNPACGPDVLQLLVEAGADPNIQN